jgi:hypothetical protein
MDYVAWVSLLYQRRRDRKERNKMNLSKSEIKYLRKLINQDLPADKEILDDKTKHYTDRDVREAKIGYVLGTVLLTKLKAET